MVVIRLSRGGTNKRPFYHVVVTDNRKPRDSGYIERLGYFNPIAIGGEISLKLEKERINHWLSKGAKVSKRVTHLLKILIAEKEKSVSGESQIIEKPTKVAQEITIPTETTLESTPDTSVATETKIEASDSALDITAENSQEIDG